MVAIFALSMLAESGYVGSSLACLKDNNTRAQSVIAIPMLLLLAS